MFVTIGALHVDRVARSLPGTSGVDTPAIAFERLGGTAFNVAVALSRMGVAARLLTCLPDDAHGRDIAGQGRSSGIEVIPYWQAGIRAPAFLAHLDASGELVSARTVSDLDRWRPDPPYVAAHIRGARCLFADANLSEEALLIVADAAAAAEVPLAVSAVSESKARRLGVLCAHSSLRYVFMNLAETQVLKNTLNVSLDALADALGASIVMSAGPDGVVLVQPNGQPNLCAEAPTVHMGAGNGNALGMGDAMAGAFLVYAFSLGNPDLQQALNAACTVAGFTAASPSAQFRLAEPGQ